MARPQTAIPRRKVYYSVTATAWTTPAVATWVLMGTALMDGSDLPVWEGRTYEFIDRSKGRGGGVLDRVLKIEGIDTAVYDALKVLGANDFVALRIDTTDKVKSVIFGGPDGATIHVLSQELVSSGGEVQAMLLGYSAAGLESTDVEKQVAYVGT